MLFWFRAAFRHTRTALRSSRHRHLVVLPLLVSVICASYLFMGKSLYGDVRPMHLSGTITADEQRTMHLGNGVEAVVFPGSVLEVQEGEIRLVRGSVFIVTSGLVRVLAGDLFVDILAGSARLSYEGGTLSVASIRAPALVGYAAERMVVPVHMQWTGDSLVAEQMGIGSWMSSRKLYALPVQFLRDMFVLERAMDDAPFSLLLDAEDFADDSSFSLQLAGAKRRENVQRAEQALAEFRDILTHDEESVSAALQGNDLLTDVLSTDQGSSFIPLLLAEAHWKKEAVSALLPLFLRSNDRYVLSAFHPKLRDDVWVLFSSASVEPSSAHLLRLLFLPQSDVLVDGVPLLVRERWQEEFDAALLHSADPALLLSTLIHALEPYVLGAFWEDLPARREWYTKALLALSVHLRDELPPRSQDLLLAYERSQWVLPVHDQASSRSENHEESPSFSAQIVEHETRSVFQAQGALFTSETSIVVISGHEARIEGIVVESRGAYHTIDCVYDIAKAQAKHIVVDGTELPYAVSVEQLFSWVRR